MCHSSLYHYALKTTSKTCYFRSLRYIDVNINDFIFSVAPGYLIGSVVDSEPGGTGFESRCDRNLSLGHTHAVNQTVQNHGILMRTERRTTHMQ